MAVESVPLSVWRHPRVLTALRERDAGRMLQLIQAHTGASQEWLADVLIMSQPQVSQYVNGRHRVTTLAMWERLADALEMPDDARMTLGLAPRRARTDAGLVWWPTVADSLSAVHEIGRATEVERRDFLRSTPFILTAFSGPVRDWLIATMEDGDRRPPRVGMSDVETIRSTFATFQELDVLHGTGTARSALTRYLNGHVLPLVRESHPERVQLALYGVASQLVYLVGWMNFDAGMARQGLAQRYLIQSLRLAHESGDPVLGSHVLAGMSDQATHLGHADEGLNLTRAGRHALRGIDAPAAITRLLTLEARALARLGESRVCAATIARAESTFEKVRPENEPEWARFIDHAYVFGEFANSFRDLDDAGQAEEFATRSVRASKAQRRARRGAFSQTALAVSYVQRGEVEAAAEAGSRALELARSVDSSRCTSALDDLRVRLLPHRATPEVRDFLDRMVA
jgi:hypothetical protein